MATPSWTNNLDDTIHDPGQLVGVLIEPKCPKLTSPNDFLPGRFGVCLKFNSMGDKDVPEHIMSRGRRKRLCRRPLWTVKVRVTVPALAEQVASNQLIKLSQAGLMV